MVRGMLSVLGLVALAGTAHANCSTANLAGNWRIIGQDNVCDITVSSTGSLSNVTCSDSSTYTGTLSLSSSCQLTGSISGVAIKGRTNPLATGAAAKPSTVVGASKNGVIAFTGFRLF